ncbi:MAG: hypothetical protein ABR530_00885 [Pyrinomonadaceae bacterium]
MFLNYWFKGICNMRIWSRILVFWLAALAISCGQQEPASPRKTFETYIKALKQKDTTTMKLLLSNATMKMHEQQAKSQGISVDEVVKRETLVTENQRTVELRDEKIEGDKATLQVKTSYGTWETVPFIREEGVWKLDKQGYADRMADDILKKMDESNRALDELRNPGGGPTPPTY